MKTMPDAELPTGTMLVAARSPRTHTDRHSCATWSHSTRSIPCAGP